MSAVTHSSVPSFAFDDSQITWHPFAGLDHIEFALLDLDEEREIVDLIVKFEPDKIVALHNHIAQTNMLIIQGELRMYATNGSLEESRPAGRYYRGQRDAIHSEGGGPEGAVVFYSVRGHGSEEMVDIMDNDENVLATVTMTDLKAAWQAQQN